MSSAASHESSYSSSHLTRYCTKGFPLSLSRTSRTPTSSSTLASSALAKSSCFVSLARGVVGAQRRGNRRRGGLGPATGAVHAGLALRFGRRPARPFRPAPAAVARAVLQFALAAFILSIGRRVG